MSRTSLASLRTRRTTGTPAARRGRAVVGSVLCASCLVAGIGLAATPARATASAQAAGGGSGTERATSMLPAYTPDGAAVRAAARRSPAVSPQDLQTVAAGDLNGVDVADYQHPGGAAINWAAVRASGVTFAYVKASEGDYYKNRYYVQDANAARAAGVSVGAYHFAEPNTPAIAQADYFAAAERAAGTTLPPVLDLETNDGLSVAALQAWTATFLARVHSDLGVVPVIYTGPYFWKDDMGDSAAFTGYPLWVANYTTSTAPDSVGAWRAWTLWQWSDGSYPAVGAVPGIAANVDRDRFAGGLTGLAELAAGSAGPWLQSIGSHIWGKALTSTQLDTFVHDLQGGAPRSAVAFSMLRNAAGLSVAVRADYERVLHRAADPGGLAGWISARAAGMGAAREAVGLTESTEFFQDSGSTTAGFINRIYATDLGRAPAPSEYTHWAAAMAQGGRAAVALGVGYSAEATGATVDRGYEQVLGRAVDPSGLATYDNAALRGPVGVETMFAHLYSSPEYLGHAGLT